MTPMSATPSRSMRRPVSRAANMAPWIAPIATAAALIGMLLLRVFTRLNGLIIALDAVTIGLFGAIGTSKALAYGVPVVPAVFIGVLAAVGGSILRDVALNLPIALMHVGSLYAIAATAGTVLLVVLVAFGVNIVVAASACVVVTTLTRLGSVRFGWSLPEQRALGSWKVWRRA